MKIRFLVFVLSFLFSVTLAGGACGDEVLLLVRSNSINYDKYLSNVSSYADTLKIEDQEEVSIKIQSDWFCDYYEGSWYYNGVRLEGYAETTIRTKKPGKYDIYFYDFHHHNYHFTFIVKKELYEGDVPECAVSATLFINKILASEKRCSYLNDIFALTDTIILGDQDTAKIVLSYKGAMCPGTKVDNCRWFYYDKLMPALDVSELIVTKQGMYKASFWGWGAPYELTFYVQSNNPGPVECDFYSSYAINNNWLDTSLAFTGIKDTITLTDGDSATLRIYRKGEACGLSNGNIAWPCQWAGYPNGKYVSYDDVTRYGELTVYEGGEYYVSYKNGENKYFYVKKASASKGICPDTTITWSADFGTCLFDYSVINMKFSEPEVQYHVYINSNPSDISFIGNGNAREIKISRSYLSPGKNKLTIKASLLDCQKFLQGWGEINVYSIPSSNKGVKWTNPPEGTAAEIYIDREMDKNYYLYYESQLIPIIGYPATFDSRSVINFTIPSSYLSKEEKPFSIKVANYNNCSVFLDTTLNIRFKIIPDISKTTSGSTVIIGSDGAVKIRNAETSILYKCIDQNNATIVSKTGDGSDLDFTIPSSYLSLGKNTIRLMAASQDTSVYLTSDAIVEVNQTLSLFNNENHTISIAPNPTKEKITVQSNDQEMYTLCIQDLSGKIMYSQKIVGGIEVNTSDFPIGLYIIQISGGHKVYTQKLIKQ